MGTLNNYLDWKYLWSKNWNSLYQARFLAYLSWNLNWAFLIACYSSICLKIFHIFHHPLQNLWGRFNQILTKCTCIFAILFLSPIKKGKIFYLNKLESLSLKDALSQVWHAHWPNLKIFSSRTTGPISTKLDSKHLLWRGFKLIQMKGQTLF